MTAYDAGTAFLQVVPSWRGWDAIVTAKIKETSELLRKGIADALPAGFRDGARAAAPEGAKAGEEFGGAFARTVRARIEAALKALPKIELKADSSDTDRKIADIRARLEALRDKRIGVDIDEGVALAQIKVLTAELDRLGSRDPSIGVRIEAARASAELAAINAEVDRLDGRTAHVNVDVDRGLGAGSALSLGTLGIAASPALIPVGAAAVGGLGGIAGLATAGGAGLGVLGLGLSGITKALQAVQAANTSAGGAATASGAAQIRAALAVAAAERQVKSAEEGLAQARASAADAAITAQERVQAALQAQAAAERNLTTAQNTQRDAQKALTEARKTAAQQLQDLTNAVTDGQLGLRQGQLDVTNARLNLQNVDSNPLSTQQQRQQAQLDYDNAVQHLKELQLQQGRLGDAQKDAAKKGIAGADVVVQAQKNLAQATQGVTDAYLAQANAAQGVADAQRAQVAQARQSAYAIEQAQNSVASSQAAVKSAAVSTASSTGALQTQLHALSPAMLAFATFIEAKIIPAVGKLRASAQAGLLPGLQRGLESLLPVLPAVQGFVGSLGKVMGDLFAQGAKALTAPFWEHFFGFVARTAGPTITTFVHILGNIVTGFAGLVEAFQPVTDQIGKGLLHLTGRFAEFGAHAGDPNSGFQHFLTYIRENGPKVAEAIGRIATFAGKLIEAFAPLGAKIVELISNVAGFMNGLSPAQFKGIVFSLTGLYGAIKGLSAITKIAETVQKAWTDAKKIALVIQGLFVTTTDAETGAVTLSTFAMLRNTAGLVAMGIATRVMAAAQWLFNAALDANPIGLIIIAIAALAAGLIYAYQHSETFRRIVHDALHFVQVAAEAVFGFFRDHWKLLLAIITGPIGAAAVFVISHFGQIKKAVSAVFDAISSAAGDAWHFVKSNFDKLVGFVEGLPARIGRAAAGLWDGLLHSFKAVINGIIRIWNDLGFHITIPKSEFGIPIPGGGSKIGIDTPDIPLLRALGGPVVAGNPYWVGDGGTPELFVPGASGHILNLKQVAAAISGLGGGATGPTAGLLSTVAGMRGPGLTRLDDLTGGAVRPLHYEQHLHYPSTADSAAHGQMRAQQLLLHDLGNR